MKDYCTTIVSIIKVQIIYVRSLQRQCNSYKANSYFKILHTMRKRDLFFVHEHVCRALSQEVISSIDTEGIRTVFIIIFIL